jgi:hypothetical protein
MDSAMGSKNIEVNKKVAYTLPAATKETYPKHKHRMDVWG